MKSRRQKLDVGPQKSEVSQSAINNPKSKIRMSSAFRPLLSVLGALCVLGVKMPTASAQTLEVTSTGVGIGTATPSGPLHVVSGSSGLIAEFDCHVDTANQGAIYLRKSRGSVASPTATQSGDLLGAILGSGRNSSGWNTGNAGFQIRATENHTSTAQGNAIEFFTTANGTASAAHQCRDQPEWQRRHRHYDPNGGDR